MKNQIQSYLNKLFPNPVCELEFNSDFQLLVAVVLSAQCTDKRVNMVTKQLFKVAPTVSDMAKLEISQIENIIKPCGFYHNKALALKNLSLDIIQKFNGQVPNNFDDLVCLRGVGRKTANVVLSVAFNIPALAVDTHVFRVSKRLNLSKANNPDKCEEDLKKIFKQSDWSKIHYQMVLFGRYHCKAIKPQCENCELKNICLKFKQNK